MKFLYAILTLAVFCGCAEKTPVPKIVMMRAKKLSVEGDFLGNGYKYTLRAAVTNSLGRDLAKVPDPHETEWDSVINYYNKHSLQVRVGINMIKGIDELIFDNSIGMYCLINVGDLNGDNRDEVALVPDLLDYSNINTCRVYSYCNEAWKEVASFRVPEDVISWGRDEPEPVFKEIPGYLEKHDGVWMYMDYEEAFNADEGKVPMRPLTAEKCK